MQIVDKLYESRPESRCRKAPFTVVSFQFRPYGPFTGGGTQHSGGVSSREKALSEVCSANLLFYVCSFCTILTEGCYFGKRCGEDISRIHL